MFWILRDNEERFIWDEEADKLYQIEQGDCCVALKSSLQSIAKFRPLIKLVEKTSKKPDVLKKHRTEEDNKKRILGK